jgi:anti-sigma factor RsiW
MSAEPTLPDADPRDEDLVAYLDGELDEPSRVRVERQLAEDASLRTRLVYLQRTWDMLDVLGRAAADEGFARTTVEMVALRAAEDVEQAKASRWRRRLWMTAGWSGGVLLSAAAGYWAWSEALARPDRQLLKDLPVIERVDELRTVDSVEYLQALRDSGLFMADSDHES